MIATVLTVIAAPPPVPETHAPASPAAPRSFASLLRQSRSVSPEPEPAGTAPPAEPAGPDEPTSTDEPVQPKGAAAPRQREGAKAASLRNVMGALTAIAAPEMGTDTKLASTSHTDGGTAATDAAPWLPGAPATRAAPADAAPKEQVRLDAAATSQPAASTASSAEHAAATSRHDAGGGAATPADGVTTPFGFGAPTAATPAAAAAEVATVTAPVDTPEFAEALAIQVSVLVSAGVQRAELHLNPADMGPVSVQIVVDGTQAQVDFGADLAATRQAIEASLPELASALREAGMTLHGGGVSQHARDRHDTDPPAGRDDRAGHGPHASPGNDARVPVATSRRTTLAGGIDLYA